MPKLMTLLPYSKIEPVTDILHGVPVTDPYRWLEDQESPRTRAWIECQSRYTRAFLDSIPGRERISQRIRQFLAVETYDSLQKFGKRYFFRKRLPDQEQHCIYMREGEDGEDQLLIDPAEQGTGKFTAVRPLQVSPDGRLLLYEVKEGGERSGTFALLDIESREALPDVLPRGYLRGFVFAPDVKSFYYAHEALDAKRPFYRAAFRHEFGCPFSKDCEIFSGGEGVQVRLHVISGQDRLGFLVYRFLDKIYTDFYWQPFGSGSTAEAVVMDADYSFAPLLLKHRIVAITNRSAPNLRIVEVHTRNNAEAEFTDIVPETDTPINFWVVAGDRILVAYIRQAKTRVDVFDFSGKRTDSIPIGDNETVRLTGGSPETEEVFLEAESFTEPISIFLYSPKSRVRTLWARRKTPFDPSNYGFIQVWYKSKDGTPVPMFLMGRRDVLESGIHPTIMTSYGGFGVSMTPQFSVFVAFLTECGCLFALPNIRGGAEFGSEWHSSAKRRNRQTAYDDFLSAAEWLINAGRTNPDKFAIFGGSNSGLLVAAALTQRPELFRAVVCMVPILDMLRYHLFDSAHIWREEFGTSDDPDDFEALARYSPYHHVHDGVAYPAVMFVSGDADRNCNSLHARKMTARLQTANASPNPIFLDYSPFRGHSPVLPLGERVKALTDRMAFLCNELNLSVGYEQNNK
jgi:prolyl oligopeptidase